MSGAVPAWKLALLERKKKQEEVEKSKKVQDEEAKLASLPAWKRAIILREKQAKGGVGPPSSAPPPSPAAKSPGKPSNKWQVAVERVKGPDSPILNQKSRSLTSPSPSFPKQSTKSQVVSRWKPQKEVSSAKVENNSAAVKPTPISTSSFTENEDDVSLAGMPAWKKALILKKRKVQQPSNVSNTEKTSSKPGGWDEPDAAITINESAKVEPVSKKSNQSSLAVRPEVVNRANREDSEVSSQRLVEQEGKTLHPPVYKEVDEWADVKEEDNKFKDLPLWKQALIKRRRADIAKRTGLPVSISTTLPPSTSNSISRPTSTRQTAPATRTSKEDSTPQPKKKKLTSKQPNKSSVESKKATKKIFPAISSSEKNKNAGASRRSKHHTGVSPSTKAKENENTKPVRKAPAPPSVEKEEMFTYNFSKSSHHTLDTGGSSDSTDSDFEEAIITNLDDSDEGDSGIVLQHYSTTTSSSPNLGKKSLSESILPVLSTPGKKTRRVSATCLSCMSN